MDHNCVICKETWDEQFVSRYETLTKSIKLIRVCEYCKDDESDYDEKEDMIYIEYQGNKYYPSYLL